LEKHKIEIEARSLIRTVPVITKFDSYILKKYRLGIFHQQKRCRILFSKLKPCFPKKVKFGVMGSGLKICCAATVTLPIMLAKARYCRCSCRFCQLANGTSILFPGADNPMRSIQQGLSAETKIIDLPVYETVLEEDVEPTGADVVVFTSPSM
jgi:hydroxymethylbilane synthase